MRCFIITGSSRGLGEALAYELLETGNQLFCISRSRNESLIQAAEERNISLTYLTYDLSQTDGLEGLMERIFKQINLEDAEGLYLVNNAGTVSPIGPVEKQEGKAITHAVQLNLIAPMLLTSSFIRCGQSFAGVKRVVNISSGAGKHAYFGWSSYCATKAGLDMFTKSVAMEQEREDHPVQILSFAPGVVDTQMQAEIRKTKEEDFIHLQRFIDLKETGKLLSPGFVAKEIKRLLVSDDFPQGAILDIRDYL